MMSSFINWLFFGYLLLQIGFPLVTCSGHFRDEQASKKSCENFNTAEMCKVCKRKIGNKCHKGGKKFELIKSFDSSNKDNYQQEISLYPPKDGFCYFDITYSHFQGSRQENHDRLYINKTANMKSCSKLGNWIITKPCDFHRFCRKNEQHEYLLHYEQGMN